MSAEALKPIRFVSWNQINRRGLQKSNQLGITTNNDHPHTRARTHAHTHAHACTHMHAHMHARTLAFLAAKLAELNYLARKEMGQCVVVSLENVNSNSRFPEPLARSNSVPKGRQKCPPSPSHPKAL